MALVFTANSNAQDPRVREALALSIDRKPIQFVLLKGAAEPTASVLPNWMTGYSPAFPTQPDVAARESSASRLTPSSALPELRSARSAVSAHRRANRAQCARGWHHGAGLDVWSGRHSPSSNCAWSLPIPRLRFARQPASFLSRSPSCAGNSVEDLYQAERSLLEGNAIIPLFHLPVASAVGPRVRDWTSSKLGLWNLADIWLETAQAEDSR